MSFKMKSFLGRAALEELQQEVVAEAETDQAVDTSADQTPAQEPAAADEPAADAAPAAPAADEGAVDAAAEAPAEAPAADAAAPDAAADDADAAPADAPAADTAESGGEAADAEAAAATSAAADEVDAQDAPAIGEEVEAGDSAEVIAEDMAEVQETAENAEDAGEDLINLQEASEALNSTLDILGGSLQRGGLDAFGAQLLRQNLGMALEKIDQSADAILLPALEDADTPSSRMGMVSDAMDSIKKFLARIGKAIADGFKKFIGWLSGIWTKLTDAFTRLKSRAEKLKGMLKGAEMMETINSRSVINSAFAVGNSFQASLVDVSEQTKQALIVLCDASSYDGYLGALEAIEAGVKNKKTEEEIEVAVQAELNKLHTATRKVTADGIIIGGKRSSGAEESGGLAAVVSLPGGRSVTLWLPTSLKEIGALSSMAAAPKKDGNFPESVPGLSQKDAGTVCDNVIATCDWFLKNASNSKASGAKFSEAVKKSADSIMVHVSAALETRDMDQGPQMQTFARSVGTWTSRMSYSLPKLPCYAVTKQAPGTLSALLDGVAASISKAAPATTGTAVATV